MTKENDTQGRFRVVAYSKHHNDWNTYLSDINFNTLEEATKYYNKRIRYAHKVFVSSKNELFYIKLFDCSKLIRITTFYEFI